MISHARQYSLLVSRLSKNARNGYGPRHRTKNEEGVSLALCCGPARHELHPPLGALFNQAGNPFFNTEFGARHLSRQSCHRAASIGMIAVLRGEVPPNDFLPPIF